MIAKITLENFFSFQEETTVELNPGMNLLVGINGSGKSNFLKAIQLLYEAIAGGGFEKIFQEQWGGFDVVANYNQERKSTIRLVFEFDLELFKKAIGVTGSYRDNPLYELSIHRSGSTGYYLGEKVYLNGSKLGRNVFLNMERGVGMIAEAEGKGKPFSEKEYPGQNVEAEFEQSEPILRQVSDPGRFIHLFHLKKVIEKIAVYDYFDTTQHGDVRSLSSYSTEVRLLPSGANLVGTLNRLKNHHSLAYEEIEERLKKINPHFKDISFDIFGNKILMALREKGLARSVPIEQISDGTLRYLIFLAILFNPKRGGLLCIDEPEIGLHPDMTNTLAEMTKEASQESQIFVATHSPLLLNSFELEEVFIFEKDAQNITRVVQKTEEDFPDWNEDFLTGQLWLMGELGGKRW